MATVLPVSAAVSGLLVIAAVIVVLTCARRRRKEPRRAICPPSSGLCDISDPIPSTSLSSVQVVTSKPSAPTKTGTSAPWTTSAAGDLKAGFATPQAVTPGCGPTPTPPSPSAADDDDEDDCELIYDLMPRNSLGAYVPEAGEMADVQTEGQTNLNSSHTSFMSSHTGTSGQTSPGYVPDQPSFTQSCNGRVSLGSSSHSSQLRHSHSSSQISPLVQSHDPGMTHSKSFGQFTHTAAGTDASNSSPTPYNYDPNYEDDEPIYDFISYDRDSISGDPDPRETSDPYYIYTRSDSGVCSDRPASETSGQTVIPSDEDPSDVAYDPVYVSHTNYVDCMSSPRSFPGLQDPAQQRHANHGSRQDNVRRCHSGKKSRDVPCTDLATRDPTTPGSSDASKNQPGETSHRTLSDDPGVSCGFSSTGSTPIASPVSFTGECSKLEFVFPSVSEEGKASLPETCASDDVFVSETSAALAQDLSQPAAKLSRGVSFCASPRDGCDKIDLSAAPKLKPASSFKLPSSAASTVTERALGNRTNSMDTFHSELAQALARRKSVGADLKSEDESGDTATFKRNQKPVLQRAKSCKAFKPPVPPKPALRRQISWFQE